MPGFESARFHPEERTGSIPWKFLKVRLSIWTTLPPLPVRRSTGRDDRGSERSMRQSPAAITASATRQKSSWTPAAHRVAKAVNGSWLRSSSPAGSEGQLGRQGYGLHQGSSGQEPRSPARSEHHAIMHSMASLSAWALKSPYQADFRGLYPPGGRRGCHPPRHRTHQHHDGQQRDRHHPASIKEIAEIAHKHGVWMHNRRRSGRGCHPVDVKAGRGYAVHERPQVQRPRGMGALLPRRAFWPL